jgi:glutathione synthase/RimK-type ligase-like ATP-grasp enzyme
MTEMAARQSSFMAVGARFRRKMDWITRRSLKLADFNAVLKRRKFRAIRDEFYDQLWQTAAADVGAVYSKTAGLTRITLGDLVTYISHSTLMLDDVITTQIMAHKGITYQLLFEKGFAVPEHCVFALDSLPLAQEFLTQTGGEIVIKPATGTGGGNGVTTGIRTSDDLVRAARHAASFNPELLAEPFLTGHCYRLLYLDGEILDVVRRDPPTICGDGHSTIRAIVATENKCRLAERPLSALSPLIIDRDALNHLSAQGFSPASRLKLGQKITLKRAVNENASSENHSVLLTADPEIIAAGARLVSDLGVRFAGLDIIADDIAAPLKASGTKFHEVNVGPGIHHHYLIADKSAGVPVATSILKYLFKNQQGVVKL